MTGRRAPPKHLRPGGPEHAGFVLEVHPRFEGEFKNHSSEESAEFRGRPRVFSGLHRLPAAGWGFSSLASTAAVNLSPKIKELRADERGPVYIARTLGINRHTVRKYGG